jgi:hypothetical protein
MQELIFFLNYVVVGVNYSNGCLTLPNLLQCMILPEYLATFCIKHHNLGIKWHNGEQTRCTGMFYIKIWQHSNVQLYCAIWQHSNVQLYCAIWQHSNVQLYCAVWQPSNVQLYCAIWQHSNVQLYCVIRQGT